METVFITGATAGIGEAIARKLADAGHAVALTGRRQDRLDAIARDLSSKKVLGIALDVQNPEAVKNALMRVEEKLGPISVLVNNAGLALGLEPAQRAGLADWDTMIDTNVKGTLHTTQAVLPGMVARNRGHIVNLGSVAGTYPYPGGNVYGATKAFVHQFSINLRCDLLGTAVRVTCIEPGMVETEFSKVRFKGDDARAKKVYEGIDTLTPDDIAEAVRWCVDLPARVNINFLEVMPTAQALSGYSLHRPKA